MRDSGKEQNAGERGREIRGRERGKTVGRKSVARGKDGGRTDGRMGITKDEKTKVGGRHVGDNGVKIRVCVRQYII